MASGRAWPRSAAARSSPTAAARAASACRPKAGALPVAPVRPGRLPNRRDFLRVQAGRRCAMPGFVLQAAPVPADLPSMPVRVGFTVSKKVGNAVIRNRIRRRLREIARQVIPGQARPDLDYVLVGRQGALERDFAVMRQELLEALKRLKALAIATPRPSPTALHRPH